MPDGISQQGKGTGTRIVYFLLLVAGFLLFVNLITVFFWDFKVFTWPTTDCTIVWSGVEENPEGSAEEAYRFKVVYRYSVDGWPYSGDRYTPYYRGSSRSEADDLLSQFSQGSRVPCYYDRKDPSYAMLDRHNPIILLPLFIASLVLLGVGGRGLWRQGFPEDRNAGCMALFLFFVLLCGLLLFKQSLDKEPVIAGLGGFFALVGGVGLIIVLRRLRKEPS